MVAAPVYMDKAGDAHQAALPNQPADADNASDANCAGDANPLKLPHPPGDSNDVIAAAMPCHAIGNSRVGHAGPAVGARTLRERACR